MKNESTSRFTRRCVSLFLIFLFSFLASNAQCGVKVKSSDEGTMRAALAEMDQGHLHEASQQMRRVAQRNPKAAEPQFWLGMLAVRNGFNATGIRKYFTKCIDLCPNYPNALAHYYMGMILYTDERYEEDFWEKALYQKDQKDRMILQARVVSSGDFVEINTYEQLRDLDSGSGHLKSDAIATICEALGCREDEVVDISVLKKGMTNRSFLFSARGSKYIMRIPGEGTDQLINRQQEAAVFAAISGKGLCDDPVYINPENGYKITAYLDNVRVCDPEDPEDLRKCMDKLRAFHEMRLTVDHTFDIFGQIEFYESLWEGSPSVYRDYKKTKANILSLKPYIDGLDKEWCLTHIDAVPDNFLFYREQNDPRGPLAEEQLQLTDWEYAGMQDPHVDIAMFCIYSLYSRAQCDRLIDIYFDGKCDRQTRVKIYIYIAMCGLLWSNWCEYKRKLGVEFGEYSLRQYRFAKDFYKHALELMNADEDCGEAAK